MSPDKRMAPDDSSIAVDQAEVAAFLGDPKTHGLDEPVLRIDTHGAVVLLAGKDVFKIKRAVRFPFMDFSTLERRRAACEAEIAVNKPNAPDIYLGTVAITCGPEGLSLDGQGEVVEWAVHMRRFDEAATLDCLADRQALSPDVIETLASVILRSHERAPRRDGEAAIRALERYLDQNDEAFAADPDLFAAEPVRRLTADARARLAAVRGLLAARGEAGYVRRCHGDLHLRNIVVIAGSPVLFDAVEFDESIATGDVLYDLAFLLMDLDERGLRAAGNLILNRYLWASDEAHLSGLAALPIFLSIRSAIRAKAVAAGIEHLHGGGRDRARSEARRYFRCAGQFLAPAAGRLVAIGGLSGTGKSTLAAELAPHLGRAPGAVWLRSDIERKRMFGVAETERLPPHAYSRAASEDVFAQLRRKASLALSAGHSVVVDAVHGERDERAAIEQVAAVLRIEFAGLWLDAPLSVRLDRVGARKPDASDADAGVAKAQAAYDVGPVAWHRLDVSGHLPDTLAEARRLLGAPHSGTAEPAVPGQW